MQFIASRAQGDQSQSVRRGPPVPSRMSLRRTKRNYNSLSVRRTTDQEVNPLNTIHSRISIEQNTTLEPSSSKENNSKDLANRLDLNLKTLKPCPARLSKYTEDEPLKDTSNIMSPTKVVEESLKDKIMQMNIQDMSVVDTKNLIEEVREKFKIPRPLSAKRRVVSDILENLLNQISDINPKIQEEVVTSQSDAPKLSHRDEVEIKPLEDTKGADDIIHVEQKAPKEDGPGDLPVVLNMALENECNDENGQNKPEQDEDTKSTFKLPSEFIADCNSDVSKEAFETPKKLRPVCIGNNSTIEISEKNEGVNIDVFEVHTEVNTKDVTNRGDIPKADTKSKKDSKCILKFSPLNKEVLRNKNVDIDLEVFKSQYLNEVDRRSYKCVFSHRHEEDNDNTQNTIRSVIDFALDAAVKKYHNENGYGIGEYVKDRPSRPVKRKYKEENQNDEGIKVKLLEGDNKECPEKADFEVSKTERLNKEAPCDMRRDGVIEVGELRRDKVKHNKYKKKFRASKRDDVVIDLTKESAPGQIIHKKREKGKMEKMMRNKKFKIRLREKAKVKNRKKNVKYSAENENKKMKQTVLVFDSKDKILKSPVKMKHKKTKSNIKSPDNLKQMSLDNFFVLKIPF
ncbi:hypothetical protein EVAR_98394_1 [Eumeta japonica]|uniref:Uncharacterized protein n=1 Tax=Eumeta variegata TaxID=151549 RepID=A0A4C1XPC8_EUMVA|nr:hypothetical protein EVAR_98394_1 [Eumeta japonica]